MGRIVAGCDKYNEQFLGCIQPIKPEFFQDKIVSKAGCGKGRQHILGGKLGAKEVVGIDLSAAVESAFQATRHLPNAHVVQADIFKLPFKRAFRLRLF
jgi:trans-aconitate methyltransferase